MFLAKNNRIAAISILMCLVGAVFYLYEYYLRIAPSVMVPQLKDVFNLSDGGIGMLVAYYYFAYVILQLPVGLMMDKWGPRRVLTFACIICSLGTWVFAVTENLFLAKVGRFLVGFGSAFAYVGVLKIAILWLPRKYFALIAGLCCGLGMVGAAGGQKLMPYLINKMEWQQILIYSAYIGLVLTILIWLIIKDRPDKIVKAKSRSSHKGQTIYLELLEVMKNKNIWLNGLIGCFAYLPLTIFAEMWAVQFFESSGFSSYHAATNSALVFVGFAIGGPIWGFISDHFKSRRKPLILGTLLAAIVSAVIIIITPVNMMFCYVLSFLCGLFASTQILVFAVGNDLCHPRLSATTLSFTNMIIMLGGLILQPVVGKVLDLLNTNIINFGAQFKDYQLALLVLPVGLFAAFVLSFILQESYGHCVSAK